MKTLIFLIFIFSIILPSFSLIRRAGVIQLYPQVPPFFENYIATATFSIDEDFRGSVLPTCRIQPTVTFPGANGADSFTSISFRYGTVQIPLFYNGAVNYQGVSISYDGYEGTALVGCAVPANNCFNFANPPLANNNGYLYNHPDLLIMELTTTSTSPYLLNFGNHQFLFMWRNSGGSQNGDFSLSTSITLNCDHIWAISGLTTTGATLHPSLSGNIIPNTVIHHISARMGFGYNGAVINANEYATLTMTNTITYGATPRIFTQSSILYNASMIYYNSGTKTYTTLGSFTPCNAACWSGGYYNAPIIDTHSIYLFSDFAKSCTATGCTITNFKPFTTLDVFYGYPATLGAGNAITISVSNAATSTYFYEIVIHTCVVCNNLLLRQRNVINKTYGDAGAIDDKQ